VRARNFQRVLFATRMTARNDELSRDSGGRFSRRGCLRKRKRETGKEGGKKGGKRENWILAAVAASRSLSIFLCLSLCFSFSPSPVGQAFLLTARAINSFFSASLRASLSHSLSRFLLPSLPLLSLLFDIGDVYCFIVSLSVRSGNQNRARYARSASVLGRSSSRSQLFAPCPLPLYVSSIPLCASPSVGFVFSFYSNTNVPICDGTLRRVSRLRKLVHAITR